MMNRKLMTVLAASLTAVAVVVALLVTLQTSLAAVSQVSTQAAAAPPLPPSVSYQGQLLDADGKPVPDDVYTMTFNVYNDALVSLPLWTQTSAVNVVDGLFNVVLGTPANPLDADVFTGGPRWIGVQVDPDPEMTPRQLLGSVPYAFRAESLRAGGWTTGTTSGTTYAFGNGGSGLALMTMGDVQIDGNLTWSTRTGRLSVSAAAFQPFDDSYQYDRTGYRLFTQSGEHYYAPLNLPDGSTVTEMTFHYYNNTFAGAITTTLRRGGVAGGSVDVMAEAVSASPHGGYGSRDDNSIDYAQVDNEDYTYWLYAYFDSTGSDLQVQSVVIEYEYTEPY